LAATILRLGLYLSLGARLRRLGLRACFLASLFQFLEDTHYFPLRSIESGFNITLLFY